MYIVDVVALVFLPRNQDQILSYYHDEFLNKGSVVEIYLSKRKIKAIVLDCQSLENRKLTFKKGVDFGLKNISKVLDLEPEISSWQLKIASYLYSYYYTPLGIAIKSVLPPFWGKRGYKITTEKEYSISKEDSVSIFVSFKNSGAKNHAQDFEKEIEVQLKNGKQIFFMVPEKSFLKYFVRAYEKFKPQIISGDTKNKEFYETWQKVESQEYKFILGTRTGLFLPFTNLGLIIVDDESNEAYKSDMTPRYYAPDLALEIAKMRRARVVFTSIVPRLETFYLRSPSSFDLVSKSNVEIVDMSREMKDGNFSAISRELKDAILYSTANNKKIILYVPRRGHANFVLCSDCWRSLKCQNCDSVLVPHKYPAEILLCHRCGKAQQKPKTCPSCGSYGLKNKGIGIEKVAEEIGRLGRYNNIGNIKILILDADKATTEKEELEIIDKFSNSNSILLTTQKIFSYKYSIFTDFIGVINADALIHIPDFRAEESIFRQLFTLANMTNKLIIQTYNPTEKAIIDTASWSPENFMNQELENRQTLLYPPYSKFVKLSYGDKDFTKAKNEAGFVYHKVSEEIRSQKWEQYFEVMGPSAGYVSREKSRYIWNIILKIKGNDIKKRNWLLQMASSKWQIDVDPKSII